MYQFFDTLLGYVEFFFSYLFGIIESALKAVVMISNSLQLPLLLSGMMPGILGTAVLVTVTILVVRFLCLK